MIDLANALATVSAMGDVLDRMGGSDDKRTEREQKRISADLCHGLRAIYFSPDGALQLLTKIATGATISEAEFSKHMQDFADEEETVRRALLHFDSDKMQRELKVSLASVNALEKIRWGKVKVRQLILGEFYRFRRKFSADQVDTAKKLVAALHELNESIERLEGRLNIQAMDR